MKFDSPSEASCGLTWTKFEEIRMDFQKVLSSLRRGLKTHTSPQDTQNFIIYFENIIQHVDFIHEFMYLKSIKLLKKDKLIAKDSTKTKYNDKTIDKLVDSYQALIPDILTLKNKKTKLEAPIFHAQNFPTAIPSIEPNAKPFAAPLLGSPSAPSLPDSPSALSPPDLPSAPPLPDPTMQRENIKPIL